MQRPFFSDAHHDSPYGRIMSAWKKEGEGFTLNITVPVNSVSDVYIPAKSAAVVF
jgi:alpha-L-rhamnosidase